MTKTLSEGELVAELVAALRHALKLLEPFDDPGLALGLGSNALAPIRAALSSTQARAESAESSLAAANERVKELERALETAEADTNLLLAAIIAGDPHKELRVRAKDIRDTLAKTAAAGKE